MTKKRILFTAQLTGIVYEEFLNNEKYEIEVLSDSKRADIKQQIIDYDPHALITLLSDKVDKELLDQLPSLEVISNYAVGYNNIDILYAAEKGIIVTNTPRVLTDATADIAFMLLLMTTRRAIESDEFSREGKFKGWEPTLFLGKSLQNKTLGIVGYGRIGSAVANRAKAFGMNVIYTKRERLSAEQEAAAEIEYRSLDQLITQSDAISLHLPFTPENRHMFDAETFRKMKSDAVFINTARGALVCESDLVDALKKGEIFSAGLDVYEFEPKIDPGLKDLKNVVLLPHIGSATEETRAQMAEMVIEDTVSVLCGNKPNNAVST